jgi:hypothetical protein
MQKVGAKKIIAVAVVSTLFVIVMDNVGVTAQVYKLIGGK